MARISKYANVAVRVLLENNNITIQQLAENLKMTRPYISKLLGLPLSEKNEEKIVKAVEEILKGRELQQWECTK